MVLGSVVTVSEHDAIFLPVLRYWCSGSKCEHGLRSFDNPCCHLVVNIQCNQCNQYLPIQTSGSTLFETEGGYRSPETCFSSFKQCVST